MLNTLSRKLRQAPVKPLDAVAQFARSNMKCKDAEMGISDDGDARTSACCAIPFSVCPLTVCKLLDEISLLFSSHMPIRV